MSPIIWPEKLSEYVANLTWNLRTGSVCKSDNDISNNLSHQQLEDKRVPFFSQQPYQLPAVTRATLLPASSAPAKHAPGGAMRITIGFFALASVAGSLMGASSEDHRAAIAAAGQAPLSFEQATSGKTGWMARGNGYRLAVSGASVEVGLNAEQLRIRFLGADTKATSAGLDPLPGKANYFVGRDPKNWLRDIPTYQRVRYKDVYPGVDMVWYGNQGRLEYDLLVQPGADASKIAMQFAGARKLTLDPNGDLRVEMAAGSLSLKLPEVYQEGGAGRKRIQSGYELRAGNEVGFRLSAYDKTRPLVIDPTLVYASYFASGYLTVQAVAVDGSGNIYMGGYTGSGFLPAVSAVQPGIKGVDDAFIVKFDPTGKTILYSTYLGGSLSDQLHGLAVDGSGNAIATGMTTSTDFPLVNQVESALGGTNSAFAFKLNSTGNTLTYSTYLGGNSIGQAVAVDTTGNAYVTGSAGTFPTTSGALNNPSAVATNTFVAKLGLTGSEVYAANIGADAGNAIAVDSTGAAYIAGYSTATTFANSPPGAHTTNAGGGDAFVAKLNPTATALVFATFLGGTGQDFGTAIGLGTGNVVYFGGQTSSTNLPTTSGVVQGTYGGQTDAFVAGLNAAGTSFSFVTYLGGGRNDALTSLVFTTGGVVVAGATTSRDFPVANAVQPAFPGAPYAFLNSTNSGASFSGADSGLPFSSGAIILPDPATSGTIVLASDHGIFRTTNDGATWTAVAPPRSGATVRSLSTPATLYSADGCSLHTSTNSGASWSDVFTDCRVTANLIGISPTNSQTVLLFNATQEFRSTNGGVSFAAPLSVPMDLSFGGTFTASSDGSIYASGGIFGLYKSTDGGLTWNPSGSGTLPLFLTSFAVSPSNATTLYATDSVDVYKSTTSGSAWAKVATGVGAKYLAVDPTNASKIYGSNIGGAVLVSSDGGVTWAPTGAALESNSVLGLAINPLNAAELYLSNAVPQSDFVTKLGLAGNSLVWSTYYGVYGGVEGGAVALAPSGNVWLAGDLIYTGSLPVTTDARNASVYSPGRAFLAEIADSTASCSYTINPSTQYSYTAGHLAFSITAPSGCAWTATPSAGWIHLIRTSGTGSGNIPLTVDANTTASTRTGTVSVGGQTYTITQPASSCTYQVNNPALGSSGGTATITVTAAAGCPWDVQLQATDPAEVTSSLTGTGNGSVTVSIPQNTGVNNLTYGVAIGGVTSNISVPGSVSCTVSFPNGTSINLPADALPYSFPVTTNPNGCGYNSSSDQPSWLALTSSPAGTVNYTVTLNNTGFDRVGHLTVGGTQITVTQAFTSAEFNDVFPGDGFFDAVNLMYEKGVTVGCVGGSTPQTRSYCPNASVTRAQMAAFIVRPVTGTLTPALYNPTPFFSDVPTTDAYFPFVQKMMELGITSGCATGPPALYCPDNSIPRWQMAVFMVRARLSLNGAAFSFNPTPYFADAPVSGDGGSSFPFIQRSYEEHITAGCGTNPLIYCPEALVTRGQMAAFIMRALFNETSILGPTAPMLTGVSPNAMASTLGTQLTVTITGANTNFQTGDTVTVPSGMLNVTNIIVNSPTSITATLTAKANTVAGPQALVVTSGGQNLVLPLAIKVGTY